jgi:hypothetical protein
MIFFDAHVHLYPEYDRDRLLDAFAANAGKLAPNAGQLALALMLREGQGPLAALLQATDRPGCRWRLVRQLGSGACLMGDGATEVFVFAARQVAARERVELLGLFSESNVPDGLPLRETYDRLRDAGALPVLAWGLGKWLFKRASVLRGLIEAADAPADLLIGDTAMRPTFWGLPRLMAVARSRGLRFVYGSDPLPRPGEENVAGGYASLIAGELPTSDPVPSLRRLLIDHAVTITPVGRRHGPWATLQRIR